MPGSMTACSRGCARERNKQICAYEAFHGPSTWYRVGDRVVGPLLGPRYYRDPTPQNFKESKSMSRPFTPPWLPGSGRAGAGGTVAGLDTKHFHCSKSFGAWDCAKLACVLVIRLWWQMLADVPKAQSPVLLVC